MAALTHTRLHPLAVTAALVWLASACHPFEDVDDYVFPDGDTGGSPDTVAPDTVAPDVVDPDVIGPDMIANTCGSQICNLHQTCDESNAEPVCRCLEGYVGEDCAACAPGWQSDGAGGCVPGELDCSQPFACQPNGECVVDAGGSAQCACTEGYDGLFCETCAAGYQDHAVPGLCEPGCAVVDLSCPEPQVCDDTGGTPRCACPRGTTGVACELCAEGYRRAGDGTCVTTCAAVELACSGGQQCVDGPTGAVCGCAAGLGGAECTSCAAGWVATAAGCVPGCAALVEQDGCDQGTCVEDSRGVGSCECAVGFAGPTCSTCAWGHTGAQCESCESNFIRLADGPCRPSCVNNNDPCPEFSHCFDEDAMQATCVCDAGYDGADCTSCEASFVASGRLCVPALSADEDMLLVAGRDDRLHIAALSTTTGQARLLRLIDDTDAPSDTFRASAVGDPAKSSVLAMIDGTLGHVDMGNGTFLSVAEDIGVNMNAMAQAGDGTVYAQIGLQIVTIDPTTGATTPLTSLDNPPYGISGLAWRESTSTLLVISGRDLFEVDPATGTSTVLVSYSEDFPVFPGDVAVAGNGEVLVSGRRVGNGFDEGTRRCRVLAWRVTGDPAYLEAPGHRAEAADGQVTVTSSSTGAEVVEVVAGAAGISVATSNPDTVVCVHPSNSPGASVSTVTLTSSAQLRAVVVDRHNVALEVATGFAPSGKPLVHLRGPDNPTFDVLDPSLQTHAELVRVYTEAQWEARRLDSSFVFISALPNSYHHSAVVRLDATASTMLGVIELPGLSLRSIEPIVSSAP